MFLKNLFTTKPKEPKPFTLIEIVNLLLERDALEEVTTFIKNNPTKLNERIYYESYEFYMGEGVGVYSKGTLLHYSCLWNRPKVVSYLLSLNADVTLCFSHSWNHMEYGGFHDLTAQQIAEKRNYDEIVALFKTSPEQKKTPTNTSGAVLSSPSYEVPATSGIPQIQHEKYSSPTGKKATIENLSTEKAAAEKAAIEKAATEKAAVEKAAVEKAAVEKAAVEKAAAEKAAVEKAAVEKAAAEKAATEKAATEKAAIEKEAAEKAAVEKAAVEKAATEKVQDPILPISQWDKQQVYQKLKQDPHFSSCADTFLKEDIDGGTLILLDDKDLKDLGMSLGLRKKFPSFVKEHSFVTQKPTFDKTTTNNIIRILDAPPSSNLRFSPIYGISDINVTSIIEAIKPLVTTNLVKHIDKYTQDALNLFSKKPLPTSSLNLDESVAIHLYTLEWPEHTCSLYYVLNSQLRSKDRSMLKPFFPYIKILLTGLIKLDKTPGITYRGVGLNLSNDFIIGDKIEWWSFTSTTTDGNACQNFLEKSPEKTLFRLDQKSGVNIQLFSNFPSESEVLLCPMMVLVKNKFMVVKGLCMVELEEIGSPLVNL